MWPCSWTAHDFVLGFVKFHIRRCRIRSLIMRMQKQSVKWILRMTFKLILLLHFERFTIMRLGSRVSNRGFTLRLPVAAPCVFSAKCPDRFWGPPTHLLNGTGLGLKLATRLHLEPWLRKNEAVPPFPHTPY